MVLISVTVLKEKQNEVLQGSPVPGPVAIVKQAVSIFKEISCFIISTASSSLCVMDVICTYTRELIIEQHCLVGKWIEHPSQFESRGDTDS